MQGGPGEGRNGEPGDKGCHTRIVPQAQRRQDLLSAHSRDAEVLSRLASTRCFLGGGGVSGGTTAKDVNWARVQKLAKDQHARKSKREADELERKRAQQAEIEEHKAKQRRMAERNQKREAQQTALQRAQTRSHWATKYARDQVAQGQTGTALPTCPPGGQVGSTRGLDDTAMEESMLQQALESSRTAHEEEQAALQLALELSRTEDRHTEPAFKREAPEGAGCADNCSQKRARSMRPEDIEGT